MIEPDYGLLRRSTVPSASEVGDASDLLLSSYNDSDRVRMVFQDHPASMKVWLMHGEYGFDAGFVPPGGSRVLAPSGDEADFWTTVLDSLPELDPSEHRVTIDITGMLRPHLMVMPRVFWARGFRELRVLYSDPVGYVDGSSTTFSASEVTEVRQVRGFEGTYAGRQETLVIGGGYDRKLVQRVAESRDDADHFLLLGLPSLEPHMYQESRYQMARAEDWLSRFGRDSFLYAPAADPFMTAQSLQGFVRRQGGAEKIGHLYLAPVGAKTQVLGFSWFALCEYRNAPVSVVFPFTSRYSERTSYGLSRVHEFVLELDWIDD